MKRYRLVTLLLVSLLLVLPVASSAAAYEVAGFGPPMPEQEAKEAGEPAGGAEYSPDATGGPDAFGYTWADQNEPNCTYNFIDISATGTPIVEGDDTSSGPEALAEPFDYYGTIYNQLVMAANGYISTDPTDTGPDLSNDCPLPDNPSTGGGARMYPLHDDLDLEAGIGQGLMEYFPVCPRPNDVNGGAEGCTIFMWDDVAHFPGGAAAPTWDMEVILYHSTMEFVYQIGSGNPEHGSGSTTGIQDPPPPTTGLTYACNAANSVPDNTAVCFFYPTQGPEVNGDSAVSYGWHIFVDVLANDNGTPPLLVDSVSQPAHGTVVNYRTRVLYIPDRGFKGTDSFTYKAIDGNGNVSSQAAAVTVMVY